MIFIVLVMFFLIGSVLMVLAVQNLTVPVHIALFMWQTPDLPVGLLIVVAFLLGALLLYIVSIGSAWQDKKELMGLQKQVVELERQQMMAQPISAAQPVPTGALLMATGTLPAVAPMPGGRMHRQTKNTVGSAPEVRQKAQQGQ